MRTFTEYEIFTAEQELATLERKLDRAIDHYADATTEFYRGYYQGQCHMLELDIIDKRQEVANLKAYKEIV